MTGVWAVMTVLVIFFGLPSIIGTFVTSVHGNARLVRGWITFMVVSLAIELVLTAIIMVLT